VINGTAPNPVRLAEMCDRLGSVMGRPSWLPVPEFAVKAIFGEGASVVCTNTIPSSIFVCFCHLNGGGVILGTRDYR
jgi:NAD dependent epimerase/dehydratase family enzyme